MTGIELINHGGTRILSIDYRGLRGARLRDRVATASQMIRDEPGESLLVLLHVRQLDLSPETATYLFENLRENTGHTLATAFVGLDHLEGILPVATRLTGRNMEAFEDENAALDWLVSHVPPSFHPDEFVGWIDHEGTTILLIDLSNCAIPELERRIHNATLAIRNSAPRSVLSLNIIGSFAYDRHTTDMLLEYIRGNKPYVLAAAVIGLDYMKAVVPVVNRLTGRNLKAFDEVDVALDWLRSMKPDKHAN